MPSGSTGYTLVGANIRDEGVDVGFGAYLNFTGAVTATLSGNVATIDVPSSGWTRNSATGTVNLSVSTDIVTIGGGAIAGKKVTVRNTAPNAGLVVVATAAQDGLGVRQSADNTDRFKVNGAGEVSFTGGFGGTTGRMYWNGATFIFDDNAGSSTVVTVTGRTILQGYGVGRVTVTGASYNVSQITDCIVFANPAAPQTINLPAANVSLARVYYIKRINNGANGVTVATLGGLIEGAATFSLPAGTYNGINVTSDGTNWWII